MQKKIIALAVAGLMSGAAFAQSNVTIYGLLDAGYGRYSGTSVGLNNGASSVDAINGSNASSSRLGFRGEEGLGQGLKAVFTIEYALANDGAVAQTAGATIGASRQTFVGLDSTQWGRVTLGHQYTPFHSTLVAVDPFGATGVASAVVIHPDVAQAVRAGSSVAYANKFGPVAVSALYGMGEQNKNGAGATAGGTFSWAAVYAQGPILAGITQVKLHNVAPTVALGMSAESTLIGGTYNFGVAKLHAGYNRFSVDGAAGANAVANHRDWHLGVTMPMGAHTFRVAYNRANDKLAANEDATHWGLGYQYDMSKRTNLYAMYGSVSNKNGASYAVNGSYASVTNHGAIGGNPGAGAREKGIVAGLRHSF